MQHVRIATLLLFGIVALGGVETAWADVVYAFTTLDVPGASPGSTQALGINDLGQIVGSFQDSTGIHGHLDIAGSFTTLDVPGAELGSTVVANGINNTGHITGYIAQQGFLTQGFLDTGDGVTTFLVPGSFLTEGFGINDSDQIVGRHPCSETFHRSRRTD